MNIPENLHAIVADDGRVFYDLSRLVAVYAPVILMDEIEAKENDNLAMQFYLAGQSDIISGIEQDIPRLRVEGRASD